MKVFVIVSDENYLGEITTNCQGVFAKREDAVKRLKENADSLYNDEDELSSEYYIKTIDENKDEFYLSVMHKDTKEIEYTNYQCIIEKELE